MNEQKMWAYFIFRFIDPFDFICLLIYTHNIKFIAPKTPPWNHLLLFPSVDSDTLHYYSMASIRLFTT